MMAKTVYFSILLVSMILSGCGSVAPANAKSDPGAPGEAEAYRMSFGEFAGVRSNWEALESAYAQEEGKAGNFRQIGFTAPAQSKYWLYSDRGEPGKFYGQNKNPMRDCPANSIWTAIYDPKLDKSEIRSPSHSSCGQLSKEYGGHYRHE